MALDISESAVYSWLRHIRKYSVVHNNWKLSPLMLDEYSNNEEILSLFTLFNNEWKKEYNEDLFSSSIKQTLRQAECDAIGIKFKDYKLSIAVVEVACHTDGLLYGDKYNTADKVVKKCILDIIMSYLCFGKTDLEVFFVSPIVKGVLESVVERIDKANIILKDSSFSNIKIKPIFNKDFNEEINIPLKQLIKNKDISSTEDSEDYLRGLMIYDF